MSATNHSIALGGTVFGAMLVELVAEALDAYHRRWR
jgi:hypothetical protein